MAETTWGVLGCAGIAIKVCEAIKEAKNARCIAVASRALEKAEAFAAENAPGATACSYDELLANPDVQVVYIPLPTGLRKEWVLKAAAAKKHVLCEKPLATNLQDAIEMVEACKSNGVQFMDDTMLMHHDRMNEMKKVIDDKEQFGAVKHVVSAFSIPFGNEEEFAGNNIRMNADTEPLGCLGDLGWYCTRVSLWAFGYEEPESVCCVYLDKTADGVPTSVHALMRYKGGRSATFDCSFKCVIRQWGEVVGEKQVLNWDDLVVTEKKTEASFSVSTASISEKAITFPKEIVSTRTVTGCVQHTQLVEKMSILASGSVDEFWPTVALQTHRVLIAFETSAKKDGAWTSV